MNDTDIQHTAEATPEWREPLTREQMIVHWETQLKMGTYLTMMALKVIRDEELYRDLGYESIEAYRKDRLPFIQRTQADRLLLIADQFGTGEVVKNMIGNSEAVRLLSDLASGTGTKWSSEAIVRMGDQELSLDEVLEQKQDEMRQALEADDKLQADKLLEEIKDLRKEMKKTKKLLESEKQMTQATEEELRKSQATLQNLTQGKIDEKRLVYISTQEDAKAAIMDAYGEISRHISIVNEIPDSIREDSEVLQHVAMLERELEEVRLRLLDTWSHYMQPQG